MNEQKIKQLLDSPDESNQLLGLQLARSVLGWSFYDIGYYVLNSVKCWERREYFHGFNRIKYHRCFCSEYITIRNWVEDIEIKFCNQWAWKIKSIFCGSELEKTKAETSEFIRKICEENSIL